MLLTRGVGDSLFSATATTAVCFASLTLASLLAVDRLGRTLSLGVIFCFFAALWMVPAILVIEDKVREWRLGVGTGRWSEDEVERVDRMVRSSKMPPSINTRNRIFTIGDRDGSYTNNGQKWQNRSSDEGSEEIQDEQIRVKSDGE